MPDLPELEIVRLSECHELEQFTCGRGSKMNQFLKKFALDHQTLCYSGTFVAIPVGATNVLGYITLCASYISLGEFGTNKIDGIEVPDRFNMPPLQCRLGAFRG